MQRAAFARDALQSRGPSLHDLAFGFLGPGSALRFASPVRDTRAKFMRSWWLGWPVVASNSR